MAKRHLDETWRELVGMLSRLSMGWPITLTEAQRLFDAALDVPLSADQIQGMAAALVQRLARRLDAGVANPWEHLLFTTDTLPIADAHLAHPPCLIGVYGLDARAGYATDIDSATVDTRRLVFPRPVGERPRTEKEMDVIVLNVWPGLDELDRFEFRRVRQGTLRWVACLDGRGFEDSWREGVLQERSSDDGR